MGDATTLRGTELFVDGILPDRMEYPGTPGEVADLLRQSAERDEGVFPIGSGLHQRIGLVPEPIDVGLSMGRLGGILRYDPEDLVVSVGAGTTLADLQTELASHGQWLPVEAPGRSDATVGGMLALGLVGPRQLGSLSMRDLLLGMSVALTDGTVVKSGGMVVKNVTGFDMGRLHVGARGTLGVITSANFKVLPRPETEATLLARFASGPSGLARAFAATDGIRAGSLRPVAADIVIEPGSVELAVRFEGRPAAVQRQIASLSDAVAGETVTISDATEAQRWWARHVERLGFADADRTALRLDARPREIGGLVTGVLSELAQSDLDDWRIVVSPGLGLVWVDLGEATQPVVSALLAHLRQGTAGVTVLGAPTAWKNGDSLPNNVRLTTAAWSW